MKLEVRAASSDERVLVLASLCALRSAALR
jgi:hypothetical protein